jgi:hypothetical protein
MKYGMKMPKPVRYLGIRLLALWRWPGVFINYILHDKDTFPIELAVAAVMKNEGPYLKEWIEYHRMAGVEKFYLYDNESSDNTKEILKPYIREGIVDYVYFPGIGYRNQIRSYADLVRRVRNRVKWLAVIDIDEFIVPVTKTKIIDIINDLSTAVRQKEHKKLFGLAIRWVQYGYGGHYTKPDGLVIENFRKNAGAVMHMKSIVNPRAAFYVAPLSVHTPMYLDFSFGRTETGGQNPWEAPISVNTVRVNHYFTKSYEEFRKKIERNKIGRSETEYILPEYDPDYMSQYEDPIMDKYTAPLRRAVAMTKN